MQYSTELLEEAKRRFPIGSKCRNSNIIPGHETLFTVGTLPYKDPYKGNSLKITNSKGTIYTIWKDGEWAIRTDIEQEYIPIIFN